MYKSFTSLVRFIPKGLILLAAIINGLAHLIPCSDYSLLVCRNMAGCFVFILYPAARTRRHRSAIRTASIIGTQPQCLGDRVFLGSWSCTRNVGCLSHSFSSQSLWLKSGNIFYTLLAEQAPWKLQVFQEFDHRAESLPLKCSGRGQLLRILSDSTPLPHLRRFRASSESECPLVIFFLRCSLQL